MSFWLHIEIDPDKEMPPDLARWCSNTMLYALAHGYDLPDEDPSVLDLAAERLGVDVGPLHKVSGGDMNLFFDAVDPNDREAWARAEQERLTYERKHEANWQNPRDLGICIRALIQALDSAPGIFGDLEVSEFHDGDYYLSGEFRHELGELCQIVTWAEENDISRIRLLLL
jgi:hypothetical protein